MGISRVATSRRDGARRWERNADAHGSGGCSRICHTHRDSSLTMGIVQNVAVRRGEGSGRCAGLWHMGVAQDCGTGFQSVHHPCPSPDGCEVNDCTRAGSPRPRQRRRCRYDNTVGRSRLRHKLLAPLTNDLEVEIGW